ncbi:MAG: hypothetical protein MUW56_12385 [Chryseobacterium sp.]|uniref:hypothetical protein n=1 Tax=Chryseobacterium sp. TaxID=1871047 RepID=UPI0025BB4AD2|nr:hypothetical protein [Chryseobacterium sp.]MCJ7934401.1 hypothetical protein [Chryseobacterium sp.]
MISFASYPYPKSESVKEILISSVGAGILVYLFLIIFQPFGTGNFHHPYKYALLFPYTIIFGVAFFVSNLTANQFNNWNIGAELLKIAGILFLSSVFSYFYNSLCISHVTLSFGNYFYMLLYSFAIGIPISAIYVLSRYIYLKRVHEQTAKDLSQQLSQKPTDTSHKSLRISTGNAELVIDESDFICAQSMENYCTIYFSENKSTKKNNDQNQFIQSFKSDRNYNDQKMPSFLYCSFGKS